MQPIIDKVSKELKECRKLIPELPEAGALERASTYRDKKITPLFNQMKGIIAGLAAQVQELNTEIEKWKEKYKREKQICEAVKKDLSKAQQRNQYLQEENSERNGNRRKKQKGAVIREKYFRITKTGKKKKHDGKSTSTK